MSETNHKLPKRILAIRLQAMGDVVISLPYLHHLRKSLPPGIRLDFLTRQETEDIPRNIVLFDKIFSIGGGRNHKKQLLYTLGLLPFLLWQRYDMVLDLQNNSISRLVRKAIAPKTWVEFDKYSPIAAGERNRLTIEKAGLGTNRMEPGFTLKNPSKGSAILQEAGWNGTDKLVVLNPAGFFATRNWPLEYYVRFAELWLQRYPNSRFVMLGTEFISEKAVFLQHRLQDSLIDLVGRTTSSEAFAILQHVSLVISEDSGLMHMAWVSGIPTITVFGSTRSDWSRPLGEYSFFFDSSDLPCGNCMASTCKMGDIRCLTRVTPEMVLEKALELSQRPRVF